MKIEKKSRFVLVGHGYHLNFLYEELIRNNFPKPIIITHPKKLHFRDIKNSENDQDLYRSVLDLEHKTKIFFLKNINTKKVLKILERYKIDYIFSLSSRFIFKQIIINNFKNKIFNIHPSILPEEQGGGTFTYRILNNKKFCAATIHLIDESIDTGKILLSSKKEKLKYENLPINYLKQTNLIYKSLIKKFIKKINGNSKFILKDQNKIKSFYLPRFYTDISGAINWSWSGDKIQLFIKACSKPYSGAFCFLNHKNKNLKIILYNANFLTEKNNRHPWFVGKIFFEDDKFIKIYVRDGILLINKDDIKLNKNIKLKRFIGKTLFTPQASLINSISHIPNTFNYKI